jgi:hypothetical protein
VVWRCKARIRVPGALKMSALGNNSALGFQIKAKCSVCKARSSVMSLLHCEVETPVFMPVGTQVRMLVSRGFSRTPYSYKL